MEFKDRLKAARTKQNLSQSALAKKVNVHVTNISRYERGENRPTTEVLNRMAEALEVTSDYLMNGSTEDVAGETISDKELLNLFKKVNTLPGEKKKLVKEFLDAFLFKNDIHQKLAS